MMALVLFIPAGSFLFWQAWVYLAGFAVLTVFVAVYFARKNPAFLAKRMVFKPDETPKKPPALLNLCFLAFVIPGLDYRFSWSEVPFWVSLIAAALFFCGYILIILVFRENSFASPSVQIQESQTLVAGEIGRAHV